MIPDPEPPLVGGRKSRAPNSNSSPIQFKHESHLCHSFLLAQRPRGTEAGEVRRGRAGAGDRRAAHAVAQRVGRRHAQVSLLGALPHGTRQELRGEQEETVCMGNISLPEKNELGSKKVELLHNPITF